MKSILRRRPSPALVISCIALFVSLGGVSYGVATGFIDSREIKNNEVRSSDVRNNSLRTFDIRNNEVRGFDIRNSTVQGRDVALNTLTGADISEDGLGKVPSATLADTATSATTANTASSVGGVTPTPFSYLGQAGGGFVSLFNVGGLNVEASCAAGGLLQLRANPAAPNGEISAGWSSGDAAGDNDFDPGDNVLIYDVLFAPNVVGTTIFAGADGRTVTVTGVTRNDSNDVTGTTNDCGFFGVAQVGQ